MRTLIKNPKHLAILLVAIFVGHLVAPHVTVGFVLGLVAVWLYRYTAGFEQPTTRPSTTS